MFERLASRMDALEAELQHRMEIIFQKAEESRKRSNITQNQLVDMKLKRRSSEAGLDSQAQVIAQLQEERVAAE